MMEWPESHVMAEQMQKTLQGRRVERVVVGHTPHKFAFFSDEPEAYAEKLIGACVERAAAQSGLVELSLGPWRLLFGDGARPRYIEPGARPPARHQLLLEFDDGAALCGTTQMYGMYYLTPPEVSDNPYVQVAREKERTASPLSAAFDRAYFDALFTLVKPSTSIKALLATEQRIPGLGNGVLQDILLHARLHPKAKALKLNQAQRERLFNSVKATLARMTESGGRDTEKDFFGRPGGYPTLLSAKTWKGPCPLCGDTIDKTAFLGGNVYACRHCQTLAE